MVQVKRVLFSVGLGGITFIILMIFMNPLNLDIKFAMPKFDFSLTGLFAGDKKLNETQPVLESLEETTSVETTTSTSTTSVVTTTSPGTTTSTTSTSTTTTTIPTANHVVFSEVFYDTGDDNIEEWIELYNPMSESIDISGLTIEDNLGTYKIPNGTIIEHRDFLVIARNRTGFYNLYEDYPDITGLTLRLNDDGDRLILKNGSEEIDMVAWENFVSGWDLKADEDQSIQRDHPDKDTNTDNDWLNHCKPDPETGGLITTSTTTPITTTIPTTTTVTPTTTTIPPTTTTIPPTTTTIPTTAVADHVVISEIQIKEEEFVELYNPTAEDVDMTGWYFSYFPFNNNWNGPTRNKQFPDGAIIKAHDFYLIGLNGYPIPIADWQPYNTSQLSNTDGSVAIFPFDPTTKPSEEAKSDKIDAVAWGNPLTVFENKSFSAPDTGKSMERKPGDSGSGNGQDTDNNSDDFILRDSPEPQNSASGIEVPK